VKPIGVSKKLWFSDIPRSSRGQRDEGHRAMQMVSERTSCVISFDNIAESLLDMHEASPPGRAANVPPPPPMTTPG
jgi:hypothetical protein